MPELFDEQDHEDNYDSYYPGFEETKVYSKIIKEFLVDLPMSTKTLQKRVKKKE